MHDLVQQMGQEIVVEQSEQKQENQSRLWTYNDISDVLTNDGGTENVEAISLNGMGISSYAQTHLEISSKAFLHMRKLRFLQVIFCSMEKVRLPEGLEYLPNSLKYLKWEYYPSSSLPSNFNPENLVELHMPCSQLKQLIWNKPLRNLKHIRLNGSEFLTTISDLTKAPKLEVIELVGTDLEELPSSICNLRSLTVLDISFCKKLNKLPEHLGNLQSLKRLRAFRSGLEELPSSIQHLRKLECLNLRYCKKLESLPYLPSDLKELYAANCRSLKSVSATFKFPHVYTDLSCCHKLNKGVSLIAQQIPWEIKFLSADKREWPGLCIVGSEVPQWMKYRNDSGSSLSLELDAHGSSIHIIFCVVVATDPCLDYNPSVVPYASLMDECRRRSVHVLNFEVLDFDDYYGDDSIDNNEMELHLEHIFLWYCRVEHNVRKASFSLGYGEEDFKIIKCGVHPIIENRK